AYTAVRQVHALLATSFAFAAGAMLALVVVEMLPDGVESGGGWRTALGVVPRALVMLAFAALPCVWICAPGEASAPVAAAMTVIAPTGHASAAARISSGTPSPTTVATSLTSNTRGAMSAQPPCPMHVASSIRGTYLTAVLFYIVISLRFDCR